MISLASKELCTACGACASVCRKKSISMAEDDIGQWYPVLDSTKCVECHACEEICPIINEPNSEIPREAYAAWSLDEEQRKSSASGGIAYELYKYALNHGYSCVGASFNDDHSVSLKITDEESELTQFKNSKYVFSNALDVYPQIKTRLHNGDKIIMMGLPCQIAAAKKLFHAHENLILIEILCHGITPQSYFTQHIESLQKKNNKEVAKIYFRDPGFGTESYTFTLYDKEGKCFYAQKISDGDSYQIGYHRGISYRESCYHCAFAKRKRVGDLILCDYYGLGKEIPCTYSPKKVSCVLVITQKGEHFFNLINDAKIIFTEKRHIEEAVNGNPRLRMTNIKNKERLAFETNIRKCIGNYEEAIAPIVKRIMKRENEPLFCRRCRALISRIKNRWKR